MTKGESISDSPLGKASQYVGTYTPSLLHSIPREDARAQLRGLSSEQGFHGEDVWTCYEMSWLAPNGGPRGAVLRIRVPHNSGAIVESKSIKLYLNSFAQTRFANTAEVQKTLDSDLLLAFRAPCLLYTSPSPRDATLSRMPSSA